jgi:hypothetical protein
VNPFITASTGDFRAKVKTYMPREHQGLKAALMDAIVNYSISLPLGIAGTIKVSVMTHDGTRKDAMWAVRCVFLLISLSRL